MAILDSSKTYIDGVDIVSGQDITDTQDTAIYAKNTVNKLSGGTYVPSKTYEYPNIVEKDGSSYMYINRTPSTGVTPPNTNYWQLIASASTAEGGGGGDITVDSSLSDTSENPVQNKVIKAEFDKFAALPIGSIITSAIPLTSACYHLLDGTTISQTGMYADFVTLLKTLVASGYNLTCTQSEFETDIGNTGNCGKFVIDDANNLVRLPKITRFIQGLSDLTNIGTSLSAGLPNITGSLGHDNLPQANARAEGFATLVSGGSATYTGFSSNSRSWAKWNLDASQSSDIYGNSATVQPEATQYPYYIVLASGYKSDTQVDVDNVANDIALLKTEKLDIINSNYSFYQKVQVAGGVKSAQINGLDFDTYDYYFDVLGSMTGSTAGGCTVQLTNNGTVMSGARYGAMKYISATPSSSASQTSQGHAWHDTNICDFAFMYVIKTAGNFLSQFELRCPYNNRMFASCTYFNTDGTQKRYADLRVLLIPSGTTKANGIKLNYIDATNTVSDNNAPNVITIYRRLKRV